MDGPEALLHIVCREEICDASEFVEEFVFETEEGCWADDGGLREDAADYFFTTGLRGFVRIREHLELRGNRLYLCSEEFRWRILVCIVRRDVNETVDIVLCDCLCNPLCSLNVDVL